MQKQKYVITLSKDGVETYIQLTQSAMDEYESKSRAAEKAGKLDDAKFWGDMAHYYRGQLQAINGLISACSL